MKEINVLQFKSTCLIAGIVLIVSSLSFFSQGLVKSMAEFKVPETILKSPQYYDAIFWVYLHMINIGIMILMLGFSVIEMNKQKWIAFLLFIILSFYTYLDFRHSDSVFGNGLYSGKASIIPAVLSAVLSLLYLQLWLRLLVRKL